jgi:hypothetical protein
VFNAIAEALGVQPPGYVTHEAAAWSGVHERWFFMPRRLSTTQGWVRRQAAQAAHALPAFNCACITGYAQLMGAVKTRPLAAPCEPFCLLLCPWPAGLALALCQLFPGIQT